MVQSRCGLLCDECEYREQTGCAGCIPSMGNPFHGKCPVAICCQEKTLDHCGQCSAFPCSQLNDYAWDAEHGDNGARLETLKEWLEN